MQNHNRYVCLVETGKYFKCYLLSLTAVLTVISAKPLNFLI